MNYEEFKSILLDALEEQKPTYVKAFDVIKAQKDNLNGIDSICIRYQDNRHVCPTMYVRDFYKDYENGWSIAELRGKILDIIEAEQAKPRHFSVEDITPENAEKNLTLRIINREWNQDMVKQCAYLELETKDLVAVPRWNVSMGSDNGSFLVTHDIQRNMLHMTDDELLQIARRNAVEQAVFTFQSLTEMVMQMEPELFEGEEWDEIMQETMPQDIAPAYVLTNTEKVNGAVALMSKNTLKGIQAKLGEDYYIIPSSLHEVLVIPESKCDDPAELQQMCKDVNATTVQENERLGENVYRFDGRQLKICNSQAEAIQQRMESMNQKREQHERMTQRRAI